MKRGSIVSMEDVELLPTFTYARTYRPIFLRLYLLRLRELGLGIEDGQNTGSYRRWSGDSVELNRGEVLLLDRRAARSAPPLPPLHPPNFSVKPTNPAW